MGDMQLLEYDTPGTAGGPGGRDRTLAIKSRKVLKNKNYQNKFSFLLPKYWGKQIFPEAGEKQKA